MIKKIGKYTILIITESYWRKYGIDLVLSNTCGYAIDRIWIDREIASEIMCDDEMMSSLWPTLRYNEKVDRHELITRI